MTPKFDIHLSEIDRWKEELEPSRKIILACPGEATQAARVIRFSDAHEITALESSLK